MTDRDQLTAELGRLHGIRIDADDPIIVAALLNRRLLDDAIAALEANTRAAADRLSAASAQHMTAAKQSASLLITEAGQWSADRLKAAAEEAGTALLAQLRQEANRAELASRLAVRAAWAAVSVTVIALAGATGVWLAGLQ